MMLCSESIALCVGDDHFFDYLKSIRVLGRDNSATKGKKVKLVKRKRKIVRNERVGRRWLPSRDEKKPSYALHSLGF